MPDQFVKRLLRIASAAVAVSLLLPVIGHPQGAEPLTLRVNGAQARSGAVVAIVVRTYASQPIRQGQVCMTVALRRSGTSPFDQIESVLVCSAQHDAWQDAAVDGSGPDHPILVRFYSPSAPINAADGPLMAVLMRVRKDVLPGSEYDVNVDLEKTVLLDSTGALILVAPREGRLRIKAPAEPFQVEASNEWLSPGAALLSLETSED